MKIAQSWSMKQHLKSSKIQKTLKQKQNVSFSYVSVSWLSQFTFYIGWLFKLKFNEIFRVKKYG